MKKNKHVTSVTSITSMTSVTSVMPLDPFAESWSSHCCSATQHLHLRSSDHRHGRGRGESPVDLGRRESPQVTPKSLSSVAVPCSSQNGLMEAGSMLPRLTICLPVGLLDMWPYPSHFSALVLASHPASSMVWTYHCSGWKES